MKKIILLLVLVVLVSTGYYFWQKYSGIYFANAPAKENIADLIQNAAGTPKPGENNTSLPLKIPDGYALSIYAKDLGNPRDLVLDPEGTLLVSIPDQGRVVAVFGNSVETVVDGLNKPHGLAFNGLKLYIAETDNVSVYDYDARINKAINKKKIIDLPGGGEHFTRSLLIKDNKLYVSIGSDCNACVEADQRRASIWQSNLDGSDFKAFATGLRNSVFLTLTPSGSEIWATNMGRDYLGDDLPPDTINVIKEGANYGWPYCYGNKVTDKQINPGNSKFDCSKMEAPKLAFQAHSAPLGLAFLDGDLLVAYHGSWNRSVPTGYKIVRFKGDKEEDFITGWLKGREVLGRPVDILVKGTDIFISDDKAGVIYLVKKI